MCLFSTPKVADPVLPTETAAMKSPDNAAVQTAAQRRVGDQARSRAATILTSGSGVTTAAPTEKKTLLGG
jgi:hypothetical protein